ncbi:MAG: hypothetical protein WBV27_07745, partial [Trichococcus sp.]|uniref:hypothetical protein n=1 Tax=Trichococcus sp. TaxID=1985464 RepID=UPI003C3B390B
NNKTASCSLKEGDSDTQSGLSSLFFLHISQRIILNADLSIPNIKKLHRRVSKWTQEHAQEEVENLTDAITAHLFK